MCDQVLKEKIKDLVERINLFAPIKEGQVIYEIDKMNVILLKRDKKIVILEKIENNIPFIKLIFDNLKDIDYLLEANTLKDYGSRLFELSVLNQKVILKTNKVQNLTKEGYYRFISHTRGTNKYEIIVPII